MAPRQLRRQHASSTYGNNGCGHMTQMRGTLHCNREEQGQRKGNNSDTSPPPALFVIIMAHPAAPPHQNQAHGLAMQSLPCGCRKTPPMGWVHTSAEHMGSATQVRERPRQHHAPVSGHGSPTPWIAALAPRRHTRPYRSGAVSACLSPESLHIGVVGAAQHVHAEAAPPPSRMQHRLSPPSVRPHLLRAHVHCAAAKGARVPHGRHSTGAPHLAHGGRLRLAKLVDAALRWRFSTLL